MLVRYLQLTIKKKSLKIEHPVHAHSVLAPVATYCSFYSQCSNFSHYPPHGYFIFPRHARPNATTNDFLFCLLLLLLLFSSLLTRKCNASILVTSLLHPFVNTHRYFIFFFFFFVFFQHLHRRFFDISVFIELLKENLKQNLFVLICSFNSVSYLSLSLPLVKSNPPFFSVHIHLFLDSLTNYRSNLALPVFICALSLFLFLAIFNEHLAEVYEFMKYERTT